MILRVIFKYILHLVAVVSATLGAALAILGYLNLTFHMHQVEVVHFFHSFGITLIVMGTIVCVLSLTGLLGNLCQNRCLLITFSGLLIFVLLVEFLVVVVAYSFYNEETLSEELKSSLQYYNEDKDIKRLWDLINVNLECCGVDSVNDWGENIPNSCCKHLDVNDICYKELANEAPCLPKLIEILKKRIPVGLAVISSIQIFCIVAAYCLSRL